MLKVLAKLGLPEERERALPSCFSISFTITWTLTVMTLVARCFTIHERALPSCFPISSAITWTLTWTLTVMTVMALCFTIHSRTNKQKTRAAILFIHSFIHSFRRRWRGDLDEFNGKDGFKDITEGKNFGSSVLVRRIPLRQGASNGRWKEDANRHEWALHFNSCFAGGSPMEMGGSRESHLPAVYWHQRRLDDYNTQPPTRRIAGRVATNDGRGRTGSALAALGP